MRLMKKNRSVLALSLVAAAVLVAVTGCSVAPQPLKEDEVHQRVAVTNSSFTQTRSRSRDR